MNNPFVTNGYVSAKYFCDREKETEDIITLLRNGHNMDLIYGGYIRRVVVSVARKAERSAYSHQQGREGEDRQFRCFLQTLWAGLAQFRQVGSERVAG